MEFPKFLLIDDFVSCIELLFSDLTKNYISLEGLYKHVSEFCYQL